MKFLVVGKGLPLEPQAALSGVAAMLTESREVFASWAEAGRMESWYHFADRPGGMGILIVESLEELNEMLNNHPAAVITSTEVYPLVDPILGFDRHIAATQTAAAK